jgi:hypothetical protein
LDEFDHGRYFPFPRLPVFTALFRESFATIGKWLRQLANVRTVAARHQFGDRSTISPSHSTASMLRLSDDGASPQGGRSDCT